MKIFHKLENAQLEVNYPLLLGTWTDPLMSLIRSDYMSNLQFFLNEKYKDEQTKIFPKKKDIFNAFSDCDFNKLKAVVIGIAPYANVKSNGLAYGVHKEYELPSFGESIKNCVNSTIYNGEDQWFDKTFEYWKKNGVLLLNTSLTSEMNDNHHLYWKNFVRNVIKAINKNHKHIVYLFLQPGNEYFLKYIDKEKNLILENKYINHIDEYSQIFENANKYLTSHKIKEVTW